MMKLRGAMIFCVCLSVLATALTGCGIRPNKLTAPRDVANSTNGSKDSTQSSRTKKEDNFPAIYPKILPSSVK